jgi:hypothetical protein
MGKTQSKALAEGHGRGTAWYVRVGLKQRDAAVALFEILERWEIRSILDWG